MEVVPRLRGQKSLVCHVGVRLIEFEVVAPRRPARGPGRFVVTYDAPMLTYEYPHDVPVEREVAYCTSPPPNLSRPLSVIGNPLFSSHVMVVSD